MYCLCFLSPKERETLSSPLILYWVPLLKIRPPFNMIYATSDCWDKSCSLVRGTTIPSSFLIPKSLESPTLAVMISLSVTTANKTVDPLSYICKTYSSICLRTKLMRSLPSLMAFSRPYSKSSCLARR